MINLNKTIYNISSSKMISQYSSLYIRNTCYKLKRIMFSSNQSISSINDNYKNSKLRYISNYIKSSLYKTNIQQFSNNNINMEKSEKKNILTELIQNKLKETNKHNILINNEYIKDSHHSSVIIDFTKEECPEKIDEYQNYKYESLLNDIKEIIALCKEAKAVSLVITIPPSLSAWINYLHQCNFTLHHTYRNNINLTLWLDDTRENKIPKAPFINMAVGVVIINPNFDFLFVKERRVLRTGLKNNWKFVTGLSDTKETILDTTFREVYEETGIKKEEYDFLGNIYYRFLGPFDSDRLMDLCFFNVVMLKENLPIETIKKQLCKDELLDAKYMNLSEVHDLMKSNSEELTYHTKAVLNRLLTVIDKNKSNKENLEKLKDNISIYCDENLGEKDSKWKHGFTPIKNIKF